jgi:hypothetical protein
MLPGKQLGLHIWRQQPYRRVSAGLRKALGRKVLVLCGPESESVRERKGAKCASPSPSTSRERSQDAIASHTLDAWKYIYKMGSPAKRSLRVLEIRIAHRPEPHEHHGLPRIGSFKSSPKNAKSNPNHNPKHLGLLSNYQINSIR